MFGKKKTKLNPAPETLIGEGTLLGDPHLVPVSIPDTHRQGHIFTMGTTRSGKTRLAELMIEQDIKKGYSILWIDPKGDIQILSKIAQIAKEAGRERELMFLSPIFADRSIRLDPLSHYFMPEEVVSHVVSGIRAKEEFFINVAYEVTLIVVQSLILFAEKEGKSPQFNFQSIKERISYPDLLKLKSQLEGLKTEEADEILSSLYQILSSPQDYFSKVSSSLRTVLTALSVGSVGKVIRKASANPFIERLEKGRRVILVIQTGSLLTRRTAHIIARVLLSMVQSFVGRVLAEGGAINPPICIHIDEASNVLYLGIEDLFNKAGGAGIWLHLMTQSYQDLVAELGEPHAKKILDNTNTKIVFRVNDPQTARYVSDLAGVKRRFSPILSLGGGVSVREMEEEKILPDEVLGLKFREIFVFTMNGIYKGKTYDVIHPTLKIKLPEIKGGDDEDNNDGSIDSSSTNS
ncbi:MAG TPA: TraM recognition domain-containing protein [Thermodesulfobacteriota bacterium]|nr:TraM recognition domain-containing protein [Thermodesulfobacteriota bacterium]